MSQLFTRTAIARHSKPDDIWIIINGAVYDVTSFVSEHPGGSDILLEYAGQDASTAFDDPASHAHSTVANELLASYFIGQVIDDTSPVNPPNSSKNDFEARLRTHKVAPNNNEQPIANAEPLFLDLQKPLMYQMYQARFTKEFYLEQIHRPRYLGRPAQFFQSPRLEILTKTPWYVIPIVWLPTIFAMFVVGSSLSCALSQTIWLWAFGVTLWSIIEYCFHRFLFHITALLPNRQAAFCVHFLMHGVHHFLPMDRDRLVMPPALFIALAAPIWLLSSYIMPLATQCSLFSGVLTGYVAYDLCHYYLHHGRPSMKHLQQMKTHHMQHHYSDANNGFGVTSMIWDRYFGTLLKTAKGCHE